MLGRALLRLVRESHGINYAARLTAKPGHLVQGDQPGVGKLCQWKPLQTRPRTLRDTCRSRPSQSLQNKGSGNTSR